MILYIVISFLLAFFLWILFGPLIIRVDSESGDYSITLPLVFKAKFVSDEELFHIRMRILFIPFRISPLKMRHKKDREKKRKPRRRSGVIRTGPGALNEVIHSFSLKKARLNIDTDDYATNAYLAPAFSAINNEKIDLTVNFQGESSVFLLLSNRLAKLVWIGIKFLYRTNKSN